MTIVEAARGVTGGVDTHLDVHVAAALDPLGGLLGTERFETNSAGYKALLAWLETFGDVTKIGIEGTGSYGSGLTRTCVEWASKSSRSIGPTERSGVAAASPIPSTPSKRPGLRSAAERVGDPSPETVPSRRSGSSSSPSARPARPGPRPSSRCVTSATRLQSSSVAASKACPCRLSSPRGRGCDPHVRRIR